MMKERKLKPIFQEVSLPSFQVEEVADAVMSVCRVWKTEDIKHVKFKINVLAVNIHL